MARSFLTPWFMEHETFVWRADLTQVVSGEAQIWLRKYMHNPDAWLIASFALSEDAIERGKAVYRALAADPLLRIHAVPPFSGEMSLDVEGCVVPNRARTQTLLVNRIHGARLVAPFSKLLIGRDNPGWAGERIARSTPDRRPTVITRRRADVLPNDDPDDLFAADDPVDTAQAATHALNNEVMQRFSWVSDVVVEKQNQSVSAAQQ